jgi:hypothetical protein
MSISSAILINDISKKYAFYSNICILTIGLISNLSLILVFVTLRTFRGNQCAFFFTVESIANIGVLLSNLPTSISTYVNNQDPTITSIVLCKIRNAISQICGLCSLFTVCFLTFDQFMSTNPRPSWRQISTLKLARRLTLFNVCFFVLHSTIFLIFTKIGSSAGCAIYNTVIDAYFTFFYYPILSSAIPILVTISFSLLAYRNVRRILRRQTTMVRRRLDRQLTAMVLARVLCLILLGLPYIIYSLCRLNVNMTGNNKLGGAIVSLIAQIIYSLLYMNFAVK